jgi:CheY-like chemotaxis protein/anti-sigma regulatory factor (Ser/Thr protein kinase)
MAQVPPGDSAHEAMRQTIDRQSSQLLRIVEDMLDISRITRGVLTLEHKPVEMAQIVRQAVETSAPAIEAGRHRLDVDLPEEPAVVEGDLHRLSQLLTNLLNNAARYTPPGGSISVRARAEGGQAVISVRDTGRGIARDQLDRIFDMFVQGRAPLKRVGGGLGIGLALARRIAEMHGGTLEAHSEGEDRGSEFTLRLPLVEEEPVREPPAPRPRNGQMTAKRVLVVDDNADAAASLSLLLRSLGHETMTVHDGREAVQAAAQFNPDIVLLDIGMPGMDGYEVARRLRALKRERRFRIVAVTGWGQEADREKSREAGFDLHLVKPVDPQDLVDALSARNGKTLH